MPYIKHLSYSVFLFLLGSLVLPLHPQAEDAADSELARVAIFKYSDQTGSGNLAYMKDSIPDALDESMQQNFEYNRVEPARAYKTGSSIEQKLVADDKAALKQASEQLNADILIYGSFNSLENGNIEIKTSIWLNANEKLVALKPVTNPVDNTVFQAIDRVAGNLISEVKRIAAESAAETEKNPEDETVEQPEEEKVVLKKDIGENKAEKSDQYRLHFAFGLPVNANKTTLYPDRNAAPYTDLSHLENTDNGLFIRAELAMLNLTGPLIPFIQGELVAGPEETTDPVQSFVLAQAVARVGVGSMFRIGDSFGLFPAVEAGAIYGTTVFKAEEVTMNLGFGNETVNYEVNSTHKGFSGGGRLDFLWFFREGASLELGLRAEYRTLTYSGEDKLESITTGGTFGGQYPQENTVTGMRYQLYGGFSFYM